MTPGAGTRFYCKDEERRAAIRDAISKGVAVNGIDFIEVIDTELVGTLAESSRQQLLLVQFFQAGLGALTAGNVRVDGGMRITPVHVRAVAVLSGVTALAPASLSAAERDFLANYRLGELERDRILVVAVREAGDFSPYTLSLVQPGAADPPDGFDPRLAAVEFFFKVECPSDFDCRTASVCPPEVLAQPAIDYLAKDYLSFRRLMLDRLSQIIPGWQERNAADLGVTLVELLAYTGDQLSYKQDAVATEAYLETARQRISVRRHTRLVDYFLGEGANARAWLAIKVDPASGADGFTIAASELGKPGAAFLTVVAGRSTQPVLARALVRAALDAGSAMFESLTDVTLHSELNELHFYSWSNRSCCLPKGATRATIEGKIDLLAAGQFLLFEELLGPATGSPFDADPRRRHVVRLTQVTAGRDPVEQVDVTEVVWDRADALPFPLCISAVADDEHGAQYLPVVSVARGNILAVDHGATVKGEILVTPGDEELFRPRLDQASLVHAAPLPAGTFVAARLSAFTAADALPAVRLVSEGELWEARADLLGSSEFAPEFVAEIDNTGRAVLRFGDGANGRRPLAGAQFSADYRVGELSAGAVGAEAIAHMIDGPTGILQVRNPLPSFGLARQESMEQARRNAPQAFRVQQRAVTAEDYARAAEGHPEVQQAATKFRWTGSWYTVFVSVDRRGGLPLDDAFTVELRNYLNKFRMAGFDLEIRPPRFVSVNLRILVCVEPGYRRSAVKLALTQAFGNGVQPGGSPGFFNPDNWTFGQHLYLSRIYEIAARTAGVRAVEITDCHRWGRAVGTEIADGVLKVGEQEIVRLDNDPSRRENGVLEFAMEGGL